MLLYHTMLLALLGFIFLWFLKHVHWAISSDRYQAPAKTNHRPPWLPYLLPGIGHSVALLYWPVEFLKPLRSSVRLRLPSINPYLVQGAPNIRSVFKQSSKTHPGAAQRFIAASLFGMPHVAADTFTKDTSGYSAKPLRGTEHVEPRNRICYRDHEMIHSLFKGKELRNLSSIFYTGLVKRLEKLPIGDDWIEMDDLFLFLATHITPAAIEAFFGPALMEKIDPNFVQDFWKFDGWVPAMAKRAPRFWAWEGFRLRDKLLHSVERWRGYILTTGDGTNGQCTAGIMEKYKLLEVDGWDMRAVAASDLGLIWASNSNTISALFWLILETLCSPRFHHQILRECEISIKDRSSCECPEFDLEVLLNQPYLQSGLSEVLRQRNHIFITRYPELGNIQLCQATVPQGSVVMISSTASHMDETSWNTGRENEHPLETFWPERFLKFPDDPDSGPLKPAGNGAVHCTNTVLKLSSAGVRRNVSTSTLVPQDKALCTSAAARAVPWPGSARAPLHPQFSKKGLEGIWIPFGGGSQMCPGRAFAKEEIFLSTALLLTSFDIELRDAAAKVEPKWGHFGTGVIRPADHVKFRIRRSMRC